MAYVYICKPCRDNDHDNCAVNENMPPPDSHICGGGHCVCSHSNDRSKFEQSVWDNYSG